MLLASASRPSSTAMQVAEEMFYTLIQLECSVMHFFSVGSLVALMFNSNSEKSPKPFLKQLSLETVFETLHMGGCRTLDACASYQETVMLEHLIVVPPVEEDPHHKEGRVLVRPESDKMRWCHIL